MDWYVILIAVIFGVPLILAPVALVWYLNVSGLYRVLGVPPALQGRCLA